ncbi:YggS family pyridoxal phosphate-dependent enzyme [Umezakia ovalisporum]|jgi:pyridoxal phosphate enzyme (YggS family)|uniref:Pyridoxal phosphate homeostasis protein n=2 Tax=Umezakia ovalisporum TaxID=75695 RepID=A0AA43H1Q2_9CYAN|nr:YggS family pyridoxal phosphate-dependent enzyme [Umezakia ovalisporum]MBI1240402.1 YggS family pyridoxal phosphate-dependent enzyme [Nostoc sp. RI_552]MDH6055994.1 YggS family pyridoxal phosphate-dependent enzyme [Umezakia ovalisporum FSS-43]MDH6065527.1 YggS family pyridoxal phosphate-dependent enzyme [Umezakia ovalisporum FSS-62]MDH6066112.1 YggS family pyridoxal phosphate-dependent enzyme [Umezakia ovalisporum APH033B]MDH6072626.1 YggS family pyridoxal phosphate-dependent enzyme [Umezak
MSTSISERITDICASLPPSVRLIAVSKTFPSEAIRAAYAAGIRDFGENRIQEAASKQAELKDLPDITWHFIGHLQSNKAKKAIELFHWIHSVDNLNLAQRLNQLAQELGINPQVCLQVKILPDPNKSGWNVPELLANLPALNQCQNLQIQGLMTITPLGLNDAETINVFNSAHKLAQEIREQNWSHLKMQELSMGMSGDYQLAVQAGATMIRLGTILFGQRT